MKLNLTATVTLNAVIIHVTVAVALCCCTAGSLSYRPSDRTWYKMKEPSFL